MEGTVNWFNIRKGYGFVKGDDGEDYFIHYTGLPNGVFLKEGDKVTFEPAKTEKGNQAKDVKVIGGSQEEPSEETFEEEFEEPQKETSEEE